MVPSTRRELRPARLAALLVLGLALGFAASWTAGCSLVNSFGDVVPQKETPVDGSSGTDGVAPATDGSTEEGAPAESGADATADASDASDASDTGDGGVETSVDASARGAVVIGGTAALDGGEGFVLTALDPTTGTELPQARETMTVSAVLYDGSRDLWYVFESGGQGIFPLPTDPFWVHTRQLDVVTGAWTELGKVAIPAGLSFATTTVEAQRVSYVAYGQGSGAPADGGIPSAFGLVTLDTSDPANVSVSSVVQLTASPIALVGTRSSVNAAGGFATLAATTSAGGTNVAQLTPVLLPSSSPPSEEAPIVGTVAVGGQTGFGLVRVSGVEGVAVVARGNGTTSATLSIYNPAANSPAQAFLGAGTFPFGDSNVKAPAFSDCSGTVFVVGTNSDLNVYAVPLAPTLVPAADGGAAAVTAVSAPTGHSGQGVYFEPYTNTVLVPFSQGDNFALTAYTFAGGQLVARQAPRWVPPADLRPNFIATRSPVPFDCSLAADF
ncbi:MAG TPA: hypothetical protein VGG39_05340 [Polyangiaceae bacterium]|jgi:hypothetical protein